MGIFGLFIIFEERFVDMLVILSIVVSLNLGIFLRVIENLVNYFLIERWLKFMRIL